MVLLLLLRLVPFHFTLVAVQNSIVWDIMNMHHLFEVMDLCRLFLMSDVSLSSFDYDAMRHVDRHTVPLQVYVFCFALPEKKR